VADKYYRFGTVAESRFSTPNRRIFVHQATPTTRPCCFVGSGHTNDTPLLFCGELIHAYWYTRT